MTLKRTSFLLGNKWGVASLLILGFVASLVVLTLMIQKSWGSAVQWMCGIYSVATGVFFIAQIIGFVMSQTHYSERIEQPKFTMLENEEAEWVG